MRRFGDYRLAGEYVKSERWLCRYLIRVRGRHSRTTDANDQDLGWSAAADHCENLTLELHAFQPDLELG